MRQVWFAASLCLAMACAGSEGGESIRVTNVVAPAPIVTGDPAAAPMALYATISNLSARADTIVAIATDAGSASIHETVRRGGMATMAPLARLVIPADSVTRLAPAGTHVMIDSLTRSFIAGDTLTVTFVFANGHRIAAIATVVDYDELERALRAEDML